MKITGVELRTIRMPLVSPFETSFGAEHERTAVLVRVVGRSACAGRRRRPVEVQGWGECVAMELPLYSSEYADGAARCAAPLPRFPGCFRARRPSTGRHRGERGGPLLEPIVGHRMAKAALEMAVLDAQLRGAGQSLAGYLGATGDRRCRPASRSASSRSISALLDVVGDYLAAGLRPDQAEDQARLGRRAGRGRPGAVRRAVPLQVDANAAYTLADARVLRRLDAFDLLLIEQPLPEDDLRQHAELATLMRTPICLDESVVVRAGGRRRHRAAGRAR